MLTTIGCVVTVLWILLVAIDYVGTFGFARVLDQLRFVIFVAWGLWFFFGVGASIGPFLQKYLGFSWSQILVFPVWFLLGAATYNALWLLNRPIEALMARLDRSNRHEE
jgi:hypothetical protein